MYQISCLNVSSLDRVSVTFFWFPKTFCVFFLKCYLSFSALDFLGDRKYRDSVLGGGSGRCRDFCGGVVIIVVTKLKVNYGKHIKLHTFTLIKCQRNN